MYKFDLPAWPVEVGLALLYLIGFAVGLLNFHMVRFVKCIPLLGLYVYVCVIASQTSVSCDRKANIPLRQFGVTLPYSLSNSCIVVHAPLYYILNIRYSNVVNYNISDAVRLAASHQ